MGGVSWFTGVYSIFFLSAITICSALGGVGAISILYSNALFAELVSHAVLPGIMVGIFGWSLYHGSVDGESATVLGHGIIVILCVCSIGSCYLFDMIGKKWRARSGHSQDTVTASMISITFGLSIFLASIIQFKEPVLYRVALSYMHGHLASANISNLYTYICLSVLIIMFVYVLEKAIAIRCCDPVFFDRLRACRWLDAVVLLLLVVTICIGMRSMGIMLTGGVMALPAWAASLVCGARVRSFVLYSMGISAIAAYIGLETSIWCARIMSTRYTPHGAWIVVIMALIVMGIKLVIWLRAGITEICACYMKKLKIESENTVKMLWHSANKRMDSASIAQQLGISNMRAFGLGIYCKYVLGVIEMKADEWYLTTRGESLAIAIVKRHRLIELYLVRYYGKDAKDVHEHAEDMEHDLTIKETELIDEELNMPLFDPHNQRIPRNNELR